MEKILHSMEEIEIAIAHRVQKIITDNRSALLKLGFQLSNQRKVEADADGFVVTEWFKSIDADCPSARGARHRLIVIAFLKVRELGRTLQNEQNHHNCGSKQTTS